MRDGSRCITAARSNSPPNASWGGAATGSLPGFESEAAAGFGVCADVGASVAVVHNGEISSYDANRRCMEMYGYDCSLLTDTEGGER